MQGLGLSGFMVSGLGNPVEQLIPSCGGTHYRTLSFGTWNKVVGRSIIHV